MEFGKNEQQLKFTSPEQELDFLRAEVMRKEKELAREQVPVESETQPESTPEMREHVAREVVREYDAREAKEVLPAEKQMTQKEKEAVVLSLAPEKHDSTMEDLLGVLQEKGLKNALDVVSAMNNPHIADDFHRFLIQYIQHVPEDAQSIKKGHKLFRALHMKLYEISLPEIGEDDRARALSEMISAMEQFYAGMLSISDGQDAVANKNYFTLEIALSNIDKEVIFFTSVPRAKSDLFEKHINAIFPDAKLTENTDDYNIFNDGGESVGAFAKASKNPLLPIKTYDLFDHDPLNILLGVFSKLKEEGEGAAIQIVVMPTGDNLLKRYSRALENVRKGVPVKNAVEPESFGGSFTKALGEFAFGDGKKKDGELPRVDDVAVEQITKKISSTILNTNIRIITSAKTGSRAQEILNELKSAFNQFTNTTGNGFAFTELKGKKSLKLFQEFSYRAFVQDESFPLNLKELSTIFHFPAQKTSSTQLRQARAGTAPMPVNMLSDGTLLGVNNNRGIRTNVYLGKEDRLRHFYTIGQTGTGKTTLLKNMIVQDIKDGNGVCMIDPHGTDIQDVLANIPPERMEDVIYFDPSDTERPIGLNMLEYDKNYPEQKTFVVNELFSIFQKLYGANPEAMGPMFEQYFRNAAMLVVEDPESGNTLLDVSRVLSDTAFRELKLSKCNNPIVVQFWREIATKAGGDAALANIVPYITSKFDVFLANEIMRPIVAQEKSAIDFRKIMDERKILLVNLAKGRLGDINSNLLGLILVGKILMAALSRVDLVGAERPADFYLYIDEFQNVTTPSIATILSEARKYGLSLNIAHQYIAQLDENIKNAVFGNVGSIAVFRVGSEDAEFLQKQLEPVFSASDIVNLENRNAYVKLLVNGQPEKAFNIETLAPEQGSLEQIAQIKQMSQMKYGRLRAEVEAEIMSKYRVVDNSQ